MLKVGDPVKLLKLEDWFFDGLPDEDAIFLRACVGQLTEIEALDGTGRAEIEFVRSNEASDYCSHALWVDVSWLEKA